MWRLRRRDPRTDESKKALRAAVQSLENVQGRQDEVSQVAESLRILRRDNHFSDHLTRLLADGTGRK